VNNPQDFSWSIWLMSKKSMLSCNYFIILDNGLLNLVLGKINVEEGIVSIIQLERCQVLNFTSVLTMSHSQVSFRDPQLLFYAFYKQFCLILFHGSLTLRYSFYKIFLPVFAIFIIIMLFSFWFHYAVVLVCIR
jgi:hypothetical protein